MSSEPAVFSFDTILADTSVWIEHIRGGVRDLATLLASERVLIHPLVIGELACGNLNSRDVRLHFLKQLPFATPATHEEVWTLIEDRKLWGKGIGCIDMHLLASALVDDCWLWTLDQRLEKAAQSVGIKLYREPVM
jgi:predicted nucleic acid-binding protein